MDQNKSLEKFTINLKNIIFFKSVIYLLCIGVLVWWFNSSEQDSIQAVQWLKAAENSLSAAQTKLATVSGLDNKITEIDDLYQKITTISGKQRCDQRIILVNSLNILSDKYQLMEPLYLRMSQLFFKNQDDLIGDRVKIKNYDLKVQFSAPNFDVMLALIRDAYELMPEYSMLISLEGAVQEVLEPSLGDKLSTKRLPDLVNATFDMYIKEINVMEH